MSNKITNGAVEHTGSEGFAVDAPLLSTHGHFASTSTGSMQLVGLRERTLTRVSEFEAQYRQPEDKTTFAEGVKAVVRKKCEKFSCRKLVSSNLPILSTLKHYRLLRDLPSDVVAGLTSGIMMIPQGLAFASLSTLQPIIGLYISFFSSITYFLLGTGQQTSFGCIAILSIMMGSILDRFENQLRLSTGQTACITELTTTMSSYLTNGTSSSPAGYSETIGLTPTSPDYSGGSFNATGSSTTTTLGTDVMGELSDLEERKLGVAGGVTLLCGIIFMVLGKVGLGKVTIIMSDSLVTGVTVGAAFHVGSSQLKAIFGLGFLPRQSGMFKLLKLWYSILANIHRSNPASIIASFVCILLIYLVKRFINEKYKEKLRVPVPIDLFVMILATVVTYYGDLYTRFDISIIKDVPTGIPTPRIPDLFNGIDFLTDGLIIITVAFIQVVSMAKLMGLKHNYKVDSNQEMFAIGMVNIVCSVFSGYISGASVSRTVVQDGAGGKSQIASLFAALLVLLVMLFIGPYFYYVPKVALAAIIVVSLRSLILKLLTIPDVWRKSRVDCVIFVGTAAGVVILDTDIGLLVGVAISIFLVLFMTIRSAVDVTAHIAVGNAGFWRSKDKYYGGQEMADIKVIRVNSPLYFINTEIITNAIFKKSGLNPLKVKKDKEGEVHPQGAVRPSDAGSTGNVAENKGVTDMPAMVSNGIVTEDVEKGRRRSRRESAGEDKNDASSTPPVPFRHDTPPSSAAPFSTLVLDMSGAAFIDLMGVKALELLMDKYGGVGVDVYVAEVRETCLDTLRRTGFMARRGEQVLLSVDSVVAHLSRPHNQEGQHTKL